MKTLVFSTFVALALLCTHSCMLETAEKPAKQILYIIADQASKEDSLLIKQFEQQHHVTVHFQLLRTDLMLERIASDRFNAGVDVLILSSDSIRTDLMQRGAFKRIKNDRLFSSLDRQFNNTHHYWLPLYYNPLVLTQPLDSSSNCVAFDFKSWAKLNDSVKPYIQIQHHPNEYYSKLASSTHFKWLVNSINTGRFSNQRILPLSELVNKEFTADSTYSKSLHACKTYLIDKKRFICTETSIGIYRFGRNTALAETFVSFFANSSYNIASGMNQNPCNKKIQENYFIRSMNIR